MPALISLVVFVLASFAARQALDAGLLESSQKSAALLGERLRRAQGKAVAPRVASLLLACTLGSGLAGWLLLDSGWAGVMAALLGACLPWAWASALEGRKLEKFSAQLASVMDLCSGALRSGQSLTQALATLAQEAPQPAAEYFSTVSQKVALGSSPESSLDELAEHLGRAACAEELRMFSTAVSVTRATGGNLAEILTRLSDTLRERERLRAEIGSMTAQGKLSGWIVGGLPVLILVALNMMDPGLMQPMFHTGLGLGLLALGALLEMLGAFFIARIVRIDA